MKTTKRLLRVIAFLLALRLLFLSWACDSLDADRSRLDYLVTHAEAGSWGPSDFYAGEWTVVTLSMTAIAAGNLAFAHSELLPAHREKVRALAQQALLEKTRAFDTHRYGTDALATLDSNEGHLGYLGHLLLVLSTQCLLGDRENSEVRTKVAAALRRRYLAAPDGLVETYPHASWIPDNAAALAAVELDAKCTGADSLSSVVQRWPKDRSGLFQFSPGVAARGSGAGWNSLYLPFISEAVAAEQWALTRARFGDERLPVLRGLDEFHGAVGTGDVDSGPLVFGVSPSGTGFGVGGATFAHDASFRSGLLATAEFAGITVPWFGRHYLLGPAVGDASVLAGRTLCRWDRRFIQG